MSSSTSNATENIFYRSSETGLLSTISFSGSDRMDNVLKDHSPPDIYDESVGYMEMISGRSGGDEEQNLITLCAPCHARLHRR